MTVFITFAGLFDIIVSKQIREKIYMVKSSDSCTTILVGAPKYCNFTI